MSIHMDILPLDRLVVILARGKVAAEEIVEISRKLIAANVPGYAKIIDVTTSESDLTGEQVERIADLLRGGPETRGAVAFVVNPERTGFAEAFADVTRGERPVELFRSLHAARNWLKNERAGAPQAESAVQGLRVRG